NAITVAPGANALLKPEHLPSLEGITHLLLQLETPLDTVTAYARAAKAAGVSVVLNAAPARALPEALLAALDVLIVNEAEPAALACTRLGAQASIPARSEVDNLLRTAQDNQPQQLRALAAHCGLPT